MFAVSFFPSERTYRRAVAFVTAAVLIFAPMAAPAAEAATAATPTSVLRTRDAATVSRGEFLRAAMRVLDILPEKTKRELSVGDVPSAFRLYVQKAEAMGAIAVFGATFDARKGITRGEALAVLSELVDATPQAAKFSYSDVRGSQMQKAVGLAIERNWMKAESTRLFGVGSPLKGKEAKLLLQRLKRSEPKEQSDTFQAPMIRLDLRTPASRALPKEDVLRAIWNLLQDDYLYKEKLDADKAINQSIDGLVKSLNDPYTTYMPKSSSENFQNQLKGELEGIGATVEQTDGIIVIVAPIKGSPAEKAGLLPQDQVLSADGVSLANMSLDDAVSKIRGPKGTTVKLRIRRNGIEFDVSVTRDTVRIAEVEITAQGTTAIVKIHQFGQTTDTELRAKMLELNTQGYRSIVLDLRNNPGGLLHAASSVVGMFLPKGSVYAKIVGRDGTADEVTEEEPVIDDATKVVVLVNEGSASASEIVAGALQDAKRARLVGKKTFGKGTVQQIVQFTDGSSLKMTIAEWKTPSGRKIDGVGIEPDDVVEKTSTRDEQLLRALELAR